MTRRKIKVFNGNTPNDKPVSGGDYQNDANNNSLVRMRSNKCDAFEKVSTNTCMSKSAAFQTDRLVSNYYSISFDTNKCKSVFIYWISIESLYYKNESRSQLLSPQSNTNLRKISANESRLVFSQMIANYSIKTQPFYGVMAVFDGRGTMYTSRMLRHNENKRFEVTITYKEKVKNYIVSIKFDKAIDLDSYNRINSNQLYDELALFVDTAIKHEPSLKMIQIGQTFHKRFDSIRKDVRFDRNKDIKYSSVNSIEPSYAIKSVKSLSFGTYISVENVMSGIAVNADRKPHYIYKPLMVTRFLSLLLDIDICKIIRLSHFERCAAIKELNGLIVEALHTQDYTVCKKYQIVGLTDESANEIKFQWINNRQDICEAKEVSISEYFRRKYNLVLEYGHLPCIEASAKNENKIYLPIEVCRLVCDQPITRRLTDYEIEEQNRESNRLKPIELFEKIKIGVNHIIRMSWNILDKFGIIIDNRFVETNAKILTAPKLRYSNRVVIPLAGKWYLNDRQNKNYTQFTIKQELKHWIIVDMSKEFTDRNNSIHRFVEMLIKHANYLGMKVMKPELVRYSNYVANRQIISNIIFPKSKATVDGLQMICFILPDNSDKTTKVTNDDLYREIKLNGDCYEGIITECINSLHVKKINVYNIDNLLAKINAKLGGTNVALIELPLKLSADKRIMIMGAHVLCRFNHESDLPSICAVVGSYDTFLSNYSTRISMQPKASEAIDDLTNMMSDIIGAYRDKNATKIPDSVVLYRDFTNDEQIERVYERERQLICKAVSGFTVMPKFTYIALTKRHKTKFVRLDSNFEDSSSSQNASIGSAVELDITHPLDDQFYLSTHNATIGTTRSLQVTVLWDDNRFEPQMIQQMTNYLCYISANYTKSTGIPTPVYYSNLAANRANIHLNNSCELNIEPNILCPKLRNVLYYC